MFKRSIIWQLLISRGGRGGGMARKRIDIQNVANFFFSKAQNFLLLQNYDYGFIFEQLTMVTGR